MNVCSLQLLSRRRLLGAALLVSCGAAARAAEAQSDEQTVEMQVKAAYLFKFAGYVEWPAGALGAAQVPFTIAVLGSEAMAAQLRAATSGRQVEERPVVVRRIQAGDALGDVAVLFVGRPEMPRLRAVLATVQPRPMLVVTESEGALAQGGMVNFLVVDRRVRFEVALDPVERNGLKLSSRLLSVAQKVLAGGA